MTSTSMPPPNFIIKDPACSICSAQPAPHFKEIGPWKPAKSGLLALPLELRDEIYKDVLRYEQREEFIPRGLGITVLPASQKLGFLLTCRQLYHEAHDIAFQSTSFHLGPSWIQTRVRAVDRMKEQLLGNMSREEEVHLRQCHDSLLCQKLNRLPVSSVALLRTFSFFLRFDVLKINWTDYVFGQVRKLLVPFQKLALTTITFYATKESPWGYGYRSVCTFIELIGSMPSLEHIQWFENTHKREGETTIREYRDRFQRDFGLDSEEYVQLDGKCKYTAIARQMQCSRVDPVTKTAVVDVNGQWCFDGRKNWERTSPRKVRVTIASFAEAKELDRAAMASAVAPVNDDKESGDRWGSEWEDLGQSDPDGQDVLDLQG